MYRKLEELKMWPRANPIDEAASARLGGEIRKRSLGNYVANYRVNDDACVVEVIDFRHAARLPEPPEPPEPPDRVE